jgi:predicted nucleic acid-binding protein
VILVDTNIFVAAADRSAAEFAAVAERLRATTIATLNHRDFRVVRPRHIAAFTLIP